MKDLQSIEIRILGCLLEKAATTPDAYPLTTNSLTNACNQKTNRDPVTDLPEHTVQAAAESLVQRGLVSTRSGAGNSRVTKFSHRLGRLDRLFTEGTFESDELAILCVLFLRGAQTPGELKTRTSRLHPFDSLDSLQLTINKLLSRRDGPWIAMLERAPGQKEVRYQHLCGENANEIPAVTSAPVAVAATNVSAPAATPGSDSTRLDALEARVDELQRTVDELRAALGEN